MEALGEGAKSDFATWKFRVRSPPLTHSLGAGQSWSTDRLLGATSERMGSLERPRTNEIRSRATCTGGRRQVSRQRWVLDIRRTLQIASIQRSCASPGREMSQLEPRSRWGRARRCVPRTRSLALGVRIAIDGAGPKLALVACGFSILVFPASKTMPAPPPPWVVQSSFAQGGTVFGALSCASHVDCQAVVGGVGGAIRTSNGGVSWQVEHPPPAATWLGAISCPSTLVCVAGGTKSQDNIPVPAMVFTRNGGNTWAWATLPKIVVSIGGISCPAVDTCVAVGGANYGVPGGWIDYGGVILRTTDGGVMWTIVAGSPSMYVSAISCASITTCQAVGWNNSYQGQIWGTSDRGRSWRSEDVNQLPALNSIVCLTASTCKAVGWNFENQNLSAVALTSDGGRNWTVEQGPPGMLSLYGISCGSLTVCASYGSYWGTNGVTDAVARTADGGKSWTITNNNVTGALGELDGIECLTPSVWLVVGGESVLGNPFVLRSTNEGVSWVDAPNPDEIFSLPGISCISTGGCEAVGGSQNVSEGPAEMRIAPGGTQMVMQQPVRGVVYLLSVSCATSLVCWVIGPAPDDRAAAVVAETVNGGSTWTTTTTIAPTPNGPLEAASIACPTTSYCGLAVQIGSEVYFAQTDDGGQVWSTDDIGPGPDGGVSCPAADACYVAAGNSFWAITSGGVPTSESLPQILLSSPTGISCPSVSNCQVVGPQDVIGTTNAGRSWSIEVALNPSDLSQTFRAVSCSGEHECQAVGDGIAMGTTDGGLSWVAETLPDSVTDFVAVSCYSFERCVAVGQGARATNGTGAPLSMITLANHPWPPANSGT